MLLDDHRGLLGRGDVVAGPQLCGAVDEAELLLEGLEVSGLAVSAAHARLTWKL
jgi:hypothetical protein